MDGIGPGNIRGEDISQLTENDYCDVVEHAVEYVCVQFDEPVAVDRPVVQLLHPVT